MSSAPTAAASSASLFDMTSDCELCVRDGGEVVARTASLRVVLVDDKLYPGFCRVIWNEHVREMTDLSPADRQVLMEAVWQVEEAVREIMQPGKVNLASLGNVVPHLHWHVIPRYRDDAQFPDPVWAAAQRVPEPATLDSRAARLPELRMTIARRIGMLPQLTTSY
jgi:diadenosine tetraphosphate (Ap4A) HIT family hydrolase